MLTSGENRAVERDRIVFYSGDRMNKEMVKRLRWALALVGTIVLIVGVALTAAPDPIQTRQLPASHLLSDGVTYIGADTCFTCHRDTSDDQPLQPITIEGAREAAKPVLTVAESGSRPVEMGGATTPYMAGALNRHDPQRYLMQTGDGFTILPGVWNRALDAWVQENPDGWPGECAGCHSEALDVGVELPAPIGTCETCHPASLPRLVAGIANPLGNGLRFLVTTLGL